MLTKQEIKLKTDSSERILDLPDLLFNAILEQRKIYEKNRSRRINDKTNPFRDLGYICCSTYGKPRSRGFVDKYYKELLEENNLNNFSWHKLRTSYTTILVKNNFSLKAISILLGHASEVVTFENYTDKNEIIYDCLNVIEPFIDKIIIKRTEENMTIDCTSINTHIFMQETYEKLMVA